METFETRQIEVEFLYLDMESCNRCKGTDVNLTTALEMAEALIDAAGATVTVRKTLVDSEETARKLGFTSSPTIRINGRDVDVDLHESRCEDCTEICGCGEDIACRVWRYKGQDYEVAPVPVLLNAIMAAVHAPAKESPKAPPRRADTSENLRRFFGGMQKRKASCCAPEHAATCCAPEDKPSCCGVGSSAPQPAACGC